MSRSLYLINARSTEASYFGGEVFARYGFEPAQGIADLAAVTVAALVPPGWTVAICDEHLAPIDFSHPARFVGITGKISQAQRMLATATEFRRRGKVVLMGGPCVSLSPELFRGHCDILVMGELEAIAAELFTDLEQDRWRSEYSGSRSDLALTPMPRWDLYPTERALSGCVQTSRGCPFECEFCDVIQYLGRRQRTKPVARILAELDVLYGHGMRHVFLADDNFTAPRRQAKEILAALRDWNRTRSAGPVAFNTQVSIDAARDLELLELLAAAGMSNVFVGIETPNEESLRETRKRQNVGVDLRARVLRFLEHGISVTAGMIVGFDHDGPDIFTRQFEFAMSLPVPIFSVGALVAPAATPLYERMKAAGRLVPGGSEVAAFPWDSNIIPAQMSREELLQGLRWLCQELYTPENFGRRLLHMIEVLPAAAPFDECRVVAPRRVESEGLLVIKKVMERGAAERRLMRELFARIQAKPSARRPVMRALLRYAQVRHLYDSAESPRAVELLERANS